MHAETRLLIADDDEAIRSLLGAFFRKKGFDVVMAQDGEEASAALRAGVDIALLDLMMPKKTGMQVLEETRELGITTPILLATAHGGESEAVVRALEIGADDYVDKPFDLAVLHARVIVRLRSSRAASGGAFVAPPSTGGSGAVSEAGVSDEPFVAAEGAVLDGRYELQRPIGKGSFGVVWRARHKSLETDVAVKLLNTDDNGGTPRLEGESSALRRTVDHGRSEELRLEGVRPRGSSTTTLFGCSTWAP